MQLLSVSVTIQVVFAVGIPIPKDHLNQLTADDLFKPTLSTFNQ